MKEGLVALAKAAKLGDQLDKASFIELVNLRLDVTPCWLDPRTLGWLCHL